MTENQIPELKLVTAKLGKSRRYQFNDEQRRKYCKNYQESGLSVKDYCILHKISQSVLRKWLKYFKTIPSFVPITQKSSSAQLNKQNFEIVLVNGLRLRFPELTNIAAIKHLIKEIGSCN